MACHPKGLPFRGILRASLVEGAKPLRDVVQEAFEFRNIHLFDVHFSLLQNHLLLRIAAATWHGLLSPRTGELVRDMDPTKPGPFQIQSRLL